MRRGAPGLHGGAHARQFIGTRHAGVGRQVFAHGRRWQPRAIRPDFRQQVMADVQAAARGRHRLEQGPVRRQGQSLAVRADDGGRRPSAAADRSASPSPGGRERDARGRRGSPWCRHPRATVIAQPFDAPARPGSPSFISVTQVPASCAFGLHPIPAIHPQARRNPPVTTRVPHRSGKTGQPLAALPARRQVFGQMGIGGGTT